MVTPLLMTRSPPRAYTDRLPLGPYGTRLNLDLEEHIDRFLGGSGVPNKVLFEEYRDSVVSMVALSEDVIAKSDFRGRAFVWAVSGAPSLGPEVEQIEVRFLQNIVCSLCHSTFCVCLKG